MYVYQTWNTSSHSASRSATLYIYIACRVSSCCMYSSCLVEDRSENRFLTKATLEIVARVRWLVCFPCTMRSVCCYFPAWAKLQHMWSCAWLASTGMGDDACGRGSGWRLQCRQRFRFACRDEHPPHMLREIPRIHKPHLQGWTCTLLPGAEMSIQIQQILQHPHPRSSRSVVHVAIYVNSPACERMGIRSNLLGPISFACGEVQLLHRGTLAVMLMSCLLWEPWKCSVRATWAWNERNWILYHPLSPSSFPSIDSFTIHWVLHHPLNPSSHWILHHWNACMQNQNTCRPKCRQG